ncbi:MAG: gamma carbonic anhydrase family protein [Spirochaeta sp.]|nr:gamma carbonic anhydrase family protein [Spirochaeta sp.]
MQQQNTVNLGSALPYQDVFPRIDESVFCAPGSYIIGDVTVGEGSSIWYHSVLRGDIHFIRVGKMTNIQDGCVCHVTHETHPLIIGDQVTIGHRAVIHGCTVEDLCLIGIGAIVLDGAVVETTSMVAAGAVVTPGMRVPTGTLVGGVPARVLRDLRADELENFAASAERYQKYAADTRKSLQPPTV